MVERRFLVGDNSDSSGELVCITVFLPRRTPVRVWRWVTDFLQRIARGRWIYWPGFSVMQATFSIDSCILGEIGELVKKCCSVENGFTLQIASWGIFYHNGVSVHLLGLKEGGVPKTIEARWNTKRTGITICGLNLNGAQITKTILRSSSTVLRSTGPPSKGCRKIDELHIPIPIEELEGVEKSFYHAAKVVEFDGMSLVVRSTPTYVPRSNSFSEGILQQNILPLVMETTKSVLESIPDLKTKQQLLVEYWKGVSQMEMIECRNKVIIQLQNLPASEISTLNSAHSLRFIPMCPSSRDREYWQRALLDLSGDHLSTGISSQSSTVHSTGGRINFLLGDFDRALRDFDRALRDFDRALLDFDRTLLYFGRSALHSGHAFNSKTDGLASTLLDRAMVKCVLARYPEAAQDINMAVEIHPNSSDLKRFQACLEDRLCRVVLSDTFPGLIDVLNV